MTSPLRSLAQLLAVVALLAAPATAFAKPALTVSTSAKAVAAGGALDVAYSVAKRPARLEIKLGGRRLATVKAKARGTARVVVPADMAAGQHRLVGCVRKRCKPAGTITVTQKPAPGPQPTPTAAPTGTPTAVPTGTPTATPTPGGPPPEIDFTGPANPLDVDAKVDATRAESATIGLGGGKLSTTGADGTKYELDIPQGALLSDERITMTPIKQVEGLPFSGGLAAGVHLEPSGLRFADHVRVTISGHPPVPPTQETGFLYQQGGKEFQLYPLAADPTRTSFQILHFSGVGVAKGTDAERGAQLLRRTRDLEGRLTQELNEVARLDRIYQLTGQGQPADMRRVEAVLRAYHDQALAPLVNAALTDDNLAVQAINRLLGWDRVVNLLVSDEFMTAERAALMDKMIQIMTNAAVKAHRRCVDENRPEELPMMLSWWRQLALIGVNLPGATFDAIKGCARFELDFRTKLSQKHDLGMQEGPQFWNGEALLENLIIEPDPMSLQQRGSKAAQYLDFEITIPPHQGGTGCWMGSKEWETTFPFTVPQLEVDLNPIQKPDGSYGYPEIARGAIRLSIMQFAPTEWVFLADCNGVGQPYEQHWLGLTWFELHEDEKNEFGSVVITDWNAPVGGGSMLGAKTYFRTVNSFGFPTTEETTIELYHAPVG